MKKKLLYIYPQYTSFIRKDFILLSKHYSTCKLLFQPSIKIYTPFLFIQQFLYLIFNLHKFDIIVCQFAGYHSFLPSIFGKVLKKPCLIILAGTDCVSFPSINYGNFNKLLQGLFTKLSYKYCTWVAPVHKSLVLCDYTYTTDDFPKQGYLYHYPKARVEFTEIYYGFDDDLFRKTSVNRKKKSFITVSQSIDKPTFYRKGINLILEVAKYFPECQFTIVGKGDISNLNISSNVSVIPYVEYEKLPDLYSSHEFYFQLSICEGFPNALCEAMLCECIPIGSDVAAIPDIIDNTGYILKKKNINLLCDLIRNALLSNKNDLSKIARKRILDNYPIERRERELIALCKKLID